MPGRFLQRLARHLLPTGVCESVVDALLADLQHEWQRHAEAGRRRVLRLARGYVAFWVALGLCGLRTTLRAAASPVEIDLVRPAALGFIIAACGVAALRYAFSSKYRQLPPGILALEQLSTLGFSVVFAMVPALMYARREPDRAWSATTSRLLIAGTFVTILFVGWLGPALSGAAWHANGRFVDGVQPAFQSLPNVIRELRKATAAEDVELCRAQLHGRVSMIATAFVLGLIGWQLSARRRPSIARAVVWWFAMMELVVVSSSYAGRSLVMVWRAPLLLLAILLILHLRGPNPRDLPGPLDPPDLPDRRDLPDAATT
jgi:hypothetical protein